MNPPPHHPLVQAGNGALQFHCPGANGERGALQRYVQEGGISKPFEVNGKKAILEKRICRVQYPVGRFMHYGTGFLIGPSWIMTNYHVIKPLCARSVKSEYFKDLTWQQVWSKIDICFDADGIHSLGTIKKLDAKKPLLYASKYHALDTIHHEFDQSWPDSHFDVAILQLEDPIGNEPIPFLSGQKRGWVSLRDDTRCLLNGIDNLPSNVFIFQHAAGESSGVAEGQLKTINLNRSRVRYNANTTGGSSGSPCFLSSGLHLIALHHAGDPRPEEQDRAAPEPPYPTDRPKPHPEYNQGIPITKIVTHLAQAARRQHLVAHTAAPFTAFGTLQNFAYLLLQKELDAENGIDRAIQTLDNRLVKPLTRLKDCYLGLKSHQLPPQARNLAIFEVVELSGKLLLVQEMVEALLVASPALSAVSPSTAPGSKIHFAPASDPYALFMTDDRKAFISRPGLIEFARDMWTYSSSRAVLVEGTELTGRSFLFHYFRSLENHFQNSKTKGFNICHINLRELATRKTPNALNLGLAIESGLEIKNPFCAKIAETEAIKYEPCANQLGDSIVESKKRYLVFIDGFDKAPCTPDCYLLISQLIEMAESRAVSIRFVLVGFERVRLGNKGRDKALTVKTGNFTEEEIIAFLERMFDYLRDLHPDNDDEGTDLASTAKDILLNAQKKQTGNLVSNAEMICTKLCSEVFKFNPVPPH